jgi:hypothetical protein
VVEVVISGFCAECGKPIVLGEIHLRKNVGVYRGPFGRVRQDLILCARHTKNPFVSNHTRRLEGLMVKASEVVEKKREGERV